jgi:hypothetical protein
VAVVPSDTRRFSGEPPEAASIQELLPPSAHPPAHVTPTAALQLAESPPVAGRGKRVRELRVLPPDAKRRRRLVWNIVVYALGIVILVATLAVLVRMGG